MGPSTAVSISYDATAVSAGADAPNLPAAVALCDADTFNCWGWSLYGVYTSALAASGDTSTITYTSAFASGTFFEAFAAEVPTAANVLTLLGSSGDLTQVSVSGSVAGYGFSDVYWFTDAVTTKWPKGELAYRF